MNKHLKDWVKFWKSVDSKTDQEIILKQLEEIKKDAQKERDTQWIKVLEEFIKGERVLNIKNLREVRD